MQNRWSYIMQTKLTIFLKFEQSDFAYKNIFVLNKGFIVDNI